MKPSERGQILVLMILMMVALLGAAGLAIDGVRQYADRRNTQAAADNAALAAALALCNDEDVSSAALASAAINGFDNNGDTNSVTVNHPPDDGFYAGNDEYIEVVINSEQQASFAQVVFSGDLESTSRAVARCFGETGPLGGGNGILVLDSNDNCAFAASGNGSITVTGGGIQVDSSRAGNAMCASGNAQVNASANISVVGGYSESGNADSTPDPLTGMAAIGDPLSSLAPPPKPGGSCITYNLSGNNTGTINEGLYCSITASGNAVVTMNPGIYYIESGNFNISGNASLTANGVMIFLENGDFSISGNGNFEITAPTSGAYQGMMIFADQTNVSTISLTGNGLVNTTGTIYGALAQGHLSGNGTNTVLNAQVIVNTLQVSGNGDLAVNYDADLVYSGGNSAFIELAQ